MNVKKSLENRIRGWFPKEPNIAKTPAKIDFQTNPQPLKINQIPKGAVSSTKIFGFQAIFYSFFSIFWIIQANAVRQIALTSLIIWITAGLTVGFVLSAISAQRQLEHLTREYGLQVPKVGALSLGFIVGSVLLVMIVGYSLLFLNLLEITVGFLSSGSACLPTVLIARCLLFRRFEKMKKIRIMHYWFKTGFLVIPQSDANSIEDAGAT